MAVVLKDVCQIKLRLKLCLQSLKGSSACVSMNSCMLLLVQDLCCVNEIMHAFLGGELHLTPYPDCTQTVCNTQQNGSLQQISSLLLEIQLCFSNPIHLWDFHTWALLILLLFLSWFCSGFLQIPSLCVQPTVPLELNMPNQYCLCAEFQSQLLFPWHAFLLHC